MRRFATAIALALSTSVGHAVPYVPTDDSVVLERLPAKSDPAIAELARMQRELAGRRNDLGAATSVARRAIQAARSTGDPRYLGQAQAALAPWWSQPDAPPMVLLLRATILQSIHDFDAALADLDRLIAANPNDSQALLTRATVLTVRGRYEDAKRDCTRLSRRAEAIVVTTCLAAAQSMAGEAAQAYAQLDEVLRMPGGDAATKAWAATLAGEIAERRGDQAAAERHFTRALGFDSRDGYLKAAYADFLLANGRPDVVVRMLANDTRNDSLLLRLALAEKALPTERAAYETHRAELGARFAAARQRGDVLHLREEARHALDIEGDARRALPLARENWTKQREPADLLILARAAEATKDAATLREVSDWIKTHRYEDVRFARFRGPRS
ncbi:MAG TPA: hypothetical protein VNG69_18125 [Casimicrobiaceae bacterium]|nr:hypothetical protein [Casimicrobiaceae bacterium]